MKDAKCYSSYRWIVLLALMLLTAAIELQWLSLASVARPATVFYGGQIADNSFLNIDFLALVFMIIYLIFAMPASWIIARFGLKTGLGLGAVLLGVFSLVKGFYADDFTIVLVAQIGLAIAQPFILNAATTVAAHWFPVSERAMAAGLGGVFAQFVGILLAMVITPMLIVSDPALPGYGSGIDYAMSVFGWGCAAVAALSLLLVRDHAAFDVDEGLEHTPSSYLKQLWSYREMRIIMVLFIVGLGIFNAISSLTDAISGYLGVTDSDGLLGAMMILGGMVGSVLVPLVSDKLRIRKAPLVICMVGMVPAITGLAFAASLFTLPETIMNTALLSSALLGFFVLGAGPVGFQYIAEITQPVPEAVSQGVLLTAGQISGMIFVALMSMDNQSMLGQVLQAFAPLTVACLIAVLFLKESPAMKEQLNLAKV